MHLMALALITQILFSLAPLRQTSPNYRKQKTSSHVLSQIPFTYTSPTDEHRINFKIANITFRTLHSTQPAYLFSALHAHHPTRCLKLSDTDLLTVSFLQTLLSAHNFGFAGPKIWNSFPPGFCTYIFPATFHRHLITHLFQLVFQSP